tara:strand:- start:1844 stop:2587 length:744 start_codon:yes stop_codon:yes gene_type:complete
MDSVSLNDMPYEVLYNIYSKVCQCNSPLLNYRIRFVNRSFRDIVNNYDGKICRHINDSNIDKNVLYIRGNIEIYKWLYNHRIFIEYTDVFHLINNNRSDVLKLAEKYVNNKDVLFNRFYLSDGYSNEKFNIFNFGTINRSFLLLACEINNLEIVKFFLESPKSSVYIIQIGAAIDVCCEYHHLNIIEYFYKNHVDNFKHVKESKLIKCIEIFGEGMYKLIIYLLENDKIELSDKLREMDIIKNLELI